ncbi:hypothetical protein [Haliea sp. E17]|uniref:hypothetical protein n=1 Tax=Haliea sp. E17 TaxID=3401576 RepID=UPI003AAB1CAB
MLNTSDIDRVIGIVGEQGLSEATLAHLRKDFEGAHFTYCMDDDIGDARPYRECAGFNIYLVNSQDHCSVLTREIDGASGMVLAEVFEG